MVKCAVRSCKSITSKQNKSNANITFHRFPKDQKTAKEWCVAMQRTDWEPNIWSKICSMHFAESCKYTTKKGLLKLVNDAVPSLFLHELPSPSQSDKSAPLNLNIKNEVEDDPLTEHTSITYIYNDANEEDSPLVVPQILLNISDSNMDTPITRKLKNEVTRLKDIAKRRQQRCNKLSAARRRLKKKVEKLTQELKELRGKYQIVEEQVTFQPSESVTVLQKDKL